MTRHSAAIRTAYETHRPEHLGGFVPIFKVRRSADLSREEFDSTLLSMRREGLIQLHQCDPADLNKGETRDSLAVDDEALGRRVYHRMTLVS